MAWRRGVLGESRLGFGLIVALLPTARGWPITGLVGFRPDWAPCLCRGRPSGPHFREPLVAEVLQDSPGTTTNRRETMTGSLVFVLPDGRSAEIGEPSARLICDRLWDQGIAAGAATAATRISHALDTHTPFSGRVCFRV